VKISVVSGRSALHTVLERHHACFDTNTSYLTPSGFGDVQAEVIAMRETACLIDESFRAKFVLHARDMVNALATLNSEIIAPGPNRATKFGTDFVVLRLTLDEALLIFNGEPPANIFESTGVEPEKIAQVDVTAAYCHIRVVGPVAIPVLARLTEIDLRDQNLPDMALVQCAVAGVRCVVLREDSFEDVCEYSILAPREFGEYVFNALMNAGSSLGLQLAGSRARQIYLDEGR